MLRTIYIVFYNTRAMRQRLEYNMIKYPDIVLNEWIKKKILTVQYYSNIIYCARRPTPDGHAGVYARTEHCVYGGFGITGEYRGVSAAVPVAEWTLTEELAGELACRRARACRQGEFDWTTGEMGKNKKKKKN